VVDGSGIFDAHQARHGRILTHPTPKRKRKNGQSYGLTPVTLHTWMIPRSFAISSYEGSASFLVTNDLLEVCPLAR
jgi:hypothetical protein